MSETAELAGKLQEKEKEFNDLVAQFKEYKLEAQEYDKELEEDNEYKKKEIDELTKKLQNLSKKVDDYKKEVSQSNLLLDKEKEKAKKWETEAQEIKKRLRELEQSNDELGNQNRQLTFEKSELESKLAEIEEKLIISTEDLKEQLSQKTDALERLRQEHKELDEEYQIVKKRMGGDASFISDAEKPNNNNEIDTLREDLQSKEAQIEELNGVMEASQQEMEQLREEIQRLSEELEQKNDEIDNLINEEHPGNPEELQRIQQELENVKGEHAVELERLNSALKEEQSTNKKLEEAREELEVDFSDIKRNLEEALTENKDKDDEMQRYIASNAKLESKIGELKAEYDHLKQSYNDANARLSSASETSSNNSESLQHEVAQLKEQLAAKDQELTRLSELLAEREKELESQREESKALIEQANSKEAQLQVLEEKGAEAAKLIENQQNEIKSLLKSLEDLKNASEAPNDLTIELEKVRHDAELYSAELENVKASSSSQQTTLLEKLKGYEERIESLERELEAQQDELDEHINIEGELSSKLEQRDADLEELKRKLEEMREELKVKEHEVQVFRDRIQQNAEPGSNNFEADLISMRAASAERDLALEKARKELEELKKVSTHSAETSKQEIEQLQHQNNALSGELATKEKDAVINSARTNDLETELKGHRETIDALRKELSEKEETIGELREGREDKEKLLVLQAQLTQENQDLASRLKEAQEQLDKFHNELKNTSNSGPDVESARKEIEALSKEVKTIKDQLQLRDSIIKEYTSSSETARYNETRLSKENDEMREKIQKLENELRTANKTKEEKMNSLSVELNAKTKLIQDLKIRLEQLETDEINSPSLVPASSIDVAKLNENNLALRSSLQTKDIEIQQARREIAELQAEVVQVRSELQSFRSPDRLRTLSSTSSDISPIKQSAEGGNYRSRFYESPKNTEEPLGFEDYVHREITVLREKNALLEEEVSELKKVNSPAYPLYSGLDYTPFKHSISKTSSLVPKLRLSAASTGDRERSLDSKATLHVKFATPTHKTPTVNHQTHITASSVTQAITSSASEGLKPTLRTAYIKPAKGNMTNYLTSQGNKLYLSKAKTPGSESKAFQSVYHFDSIVNTSPANLEGLNREFEYKHVLGRNFFFMIYGAKHTDKKLIKYKILDDFMKFFKKLSNNEDFASKTLNMKLRMQDSRFFSKVDYLKEQNKEIADKIMKEKEFVINEQNAPVWDNYVSRVKQIDTTSLKTAYKKKSTKQLFLEFSFDNDESSNKSSTGGMNEYFCSRTRVMIVTTHVIHNESTLVGINSLQGVIDFLLTQDKAFAVKSNSLGNEQSDTVKKHFLMTFHPTVQNYKIVTDTLVLASRVEKICQEMGMNNERGLSQQNRLLRDTVENSKLRIKHLEHDLKEAGTLIKRKEHSLNKERRDYIKDQGRSGGETQDLTKRLDYYSKKHDMLKDNMKTLLSLLNQISSPSNGNGNVSVIASVNAKQSSPTRPSHHRTKSDTGNLKLDRTSRVVKKLITQIEES